MEMTSDHQIVLYDTTRGLEFTIVLDGQEDFQKALAYLRDTVASVGVADSLKRSTRAQHYFIVDDGQLRAFSTFMKS